MYSREKEFIREAFMSGALDVGRDRKTMKSFIEIMAGEMECIIAIQNAFYLSDEEKLELIKAAQLSTDQVREYRAWHDMVMGGRK